MKPEIVVCGIPFETPREAEALRYVKEHGFTSVQIYVQWRLFEPEKRGEFDWSFYDREIRALQQAGLKFVPFLPLGPKYTVPEWWLRDPNHRGLVCLEHGKESPVESIWNPAFRAEMERVMAAFAAHYGPWNVLESVQPGIAATTAKPSSRFSATGRAITTPIRGSGAAVRTPPLPSAPPCRRNTAV